MKKALLVICIFALGNPLSAQINLNSGLIARYNFSGNAADSSGNGNHGTAFRASLTSDRFGNPNSAYYFTATDSSYMEATVANLPLGNSARTLNVWAQWSALPFTNAAHVANWGQRASGELFGTGVYKDNNWVVFGYDYPAGYDLKSGIVADTNWHMITSVYESGVMKIYIDGNFAASQTKALNTTTSTFVAGTRPDRFLDCFYTGKIDDIRIYNRALNQSEITSLTNAPVSTPTVTRSPLISIYPQPAATTLFIKNNTRPVDVIITDLSGKTMLMMQQVQDRISLSGLNTGLYIVRINDGNTISIHTLSKM